jgi:16S rRNA (cytidine1402-2'-O)-methyltransferase
MVGRELTKIHQEFVRGTSEEVSSSLRSPVKGEVTVVIGPLTNSQRRRTVEGDADIAATFGHKTKENGVVSKRQAIAATAKELGLPSRAVYEALERTKIGDKTE